MRVSKGIVIACILAVSVTAQWTKQTVNTTASFRGLSVVSENVIWASGTGGTVIRTIDGGKKWDVIQLSDAAKLDFRDIEAFDANTAYILSIGNGESSRIYKTTDGGVTWKLQFKNTNNKAFFDAIACWDRNNCIAMSDPVDNKFVLINTTDGGSTWNSMDTKNMPATKDGEAAFAASGTCLITQGKNNAFLVSGGSDARVFRSNDRGKTWLVADTPMVKGTSGSGIFSIAMRDSKNGVIVGGNYEKPNESKEKLAFTTDGGKTWKPATGLSGYRSAVSYIDNKMILAVGTNGTDISDDGGKLWSGGGFEDLNTVQSKGRVATWAVGPKGLVLRNIMHAPMGKTETGLPPSVHNVSLSKAEVNACAIRDGVNCSDTLIEVKISATDGDFLHQFEYTVTGGRVVGEGTSVLWDLSGAKPGRYTITTKLVQPFLYRWVAFGKTNTRVVTVR